MIEITALVLCKLGGKDGSAEEIKAVLEAAGLTADEDALGKLTGDVDGKDLNELLAAGAETIKDVPFGGGGGGGGGSSGGGGSAEAVEEEVKVEEPEEEEAEVGGGIDMFGGDDGGGGDY